MNTGDITVSEHRRRVHYSGLYPKNFDEKYKELQPEKYASTIEKVISKGSTPAGTHIPVMVNEVLSFLDIRPGEIGFDATLGYGGHSEMMLKKLDGRGHLYAADEDPAELSRTKARLAAAGYGEDIFSAFHMNFSAAKELSSRVGPFDFVLADLGISSMQLDNPARGFSYKHDGPLDLRMDQLTGITAAERLREMTRDELAGMLSENADEPYAEEIARQITDDMRHGKTIDTTGQLCEEIEKALKKVPEKERGEEIKKSCARTFQALRIDINSEYEALYALLEALPDILKSGGRAVILSFHSGEDRLVKKSFREFFKNGVYQKIAEDVVRPTASECARNSRAHSTKLRWAVKA